MLKRFIITTIPILLMQNLHAISVDSNKIDNSPIIVSVNHSKIHSSGASSKQIIDDEKIKSTGSTSVQEILQRFGNLQISNASGQTNQASINIRGFGANADSNSLVLVNGIPLTHPDLAPPNLNNIAISNISRIEMTAGSEGVLYGDQAVGGVVNIITNETMQPIKRIACYYGSFQTEGCSGEYGDEYRSLNYHLSAEVEHADNYRDHNHDDQQHLDITTKNTYENGYLRTDINFLNENLQYPGALSSAQVRENRRQANNSSDYFKDLNSHIQLLEHHLLSDNWTLETAVSGTHMSGLGVLTSQFNQSRTSYYLKPTLKGLINDSAISVGVDFQDDDYHLASLYGLTVDSQQKYSVFTYATVPIVNRLTLSIGMRGAEQTSRLQSIETNNNLNRAIATTAGLSYQLSPASSAYIRRAGSYRFPKADENASTTPGSTGLRTQRGVSYESGWQYDINGHALNIDVYQLNLKDEIAFDPLQTPETPFGSNQNLAPTIRRGITLATNNHINNYLDLDAQINVLTAQFQNGIYKNNSIPLVADDLFHTGIQLNFSDHWHTYIDANFIGSQYAANDYANAAGKLGGYTTYNWNLKYTYKTLTTVVKITNIFNKYYYLYSAYQAWANDIYYYPAATRNIMLTVDYTF